MVRKVKVVLKRLKKAKIMAELRAAQKVTLPLALGLSLEQTGSCHWTGSGRYHPQNAHPVCDPATREEKEASIDMSAYAPEK